jgi:hypothetical protein
LGVIPAKAEALYDSEAGQSIHIHAYVEAANGDA